MDEISKKGFRARVVLVVALVFLTYALNASLVFGIETQTGDTLNDSSANRNEGTIHGASDGGDKGVPGKLGKAFSFDGVNDYVEIPDSDDWNFGSGNFTLGMWIYRLDDIHQTSFITSGGNTAPHMACVFL